MMVMRKRRDAVENWPSERQAWAFRCVAADGPDLRPKRHIRVSPLPSFAPSRSTCLLERPAPFCVKAVGLDPRNTRARTPCAILTSQDAFRSKKGRQLFAGGWNSFPFHSSSPNGRESLASSSRSIESAKPSLSETNEQKYGADEPCPSQSQCTNQPCRTSLTRTKLPKFSDVQPLP